MSRSARLALAAASLVSIFSSAAYAENRTTIQISTVLASNKSRTFDARLTSLRNELRQLRFKSYTLVNAETRVLQGSGGQSGWELPGGRYLHITTREHSPDHVRLHILLNEDNKPVVNTYVKLELGSVVLLGGPRDENGTLVISIGSRPYRAEDEDEDKIKKERMAHGDGTLPSATVPTAKAEGMMLPIPPKPPTPAVSAGMQQNQAGR